MSVSYSYPLDFNRTDQFLDEWNSSFTVHDMGQTGIFEFVFASYSPNNGDECLTANSTIDTSVVTISKTANATLNWDTSNKIITVADSVSVTYDSASPLKAVFLRKKSNGFVLGYSIFQTTVTVSDSVIIDEGTIIWSFVDGN